jgi:prepilin-type processing-associated H-X9-DG protein/prepilin-type N-terminal cleavage/methylation domain-containing protein
MKSPLRQSAFTLIELLTVIAIIGILAAIIIPTVGKVRESARKAQSLSNLRQIGQAVIMYAQDNKDRLIHANEVAGEWFTSPLQNFVEGRPVGSPQWVTSSNVSPAYRCPAFETTQPWRTGFGIYYYLNAYIEPGNFSRTNEARWIGALRTAQFQAPSRTIIIGSAPGLVLDVRRSTGFVAENSDPKRHGNTANYLFLDGHVRSLSEVDALQIFP